MRNLPVAAQAYIWGVTVSGALILVWLFPIDLLTDPLRLLLTVAAGVVVFVTETHPIPVSYKARSSVSAVAQFGGLLIMGPGAACLGNAIGTGLALARLGRRWYNVVFNIGAYTLTIACASLVYTLTASGPRSLIVLSAQNTVALILTGAVFFVVNTGLVAGIITLRRRQSMWSTWTSIVQGTAAEYSAMLLLGILSALVFQIAWWGLTLIALPVGLVYRHLCISHELRVQTTQATVEAVEALADALDSRDIYTFDHSQRVANYAVRIARQLKLPSYDVETIRLSARVHDLGKLGISDELLYKPARFTIQEREAFKQHVLLGARIISRFPRYQEGKDLILYHHEWYDGNGYLNGLKRDQIPIGARIIAVADAYDAMTTRRPYRPALSPAEARRELLRCSGCQFDPLVVAAFLKVLETEVPQVMITSDIGLVWQALPQPMYPESAVRS